MLILAGDLGGTNCRLALYETGSGGLHRLQQARYASADHADLLMMVRAFLNHAGATPSGAVFGVPGPVVGQRAKLTNLPWVVRADRLRNQLAVEEVLLLNDLEAAAWGVDEVSDDQGVTLQQGAPTSRGNRAVIAAGTGLGQAGATWHGDGYRPFACEGGHSSFSPTLPLHVQMLVAAQRELGHVSWERFVTGSGLERIYRFLRHREGQGVPDWLHDPDKDPAEAIAEAALGGRCDLAIEAIDHLAHLLGSAAGNLALVLMATGGLYVVGGIAPKILDQRRTRFFLEGFLGKGRMGTVLETVPVRMIQDPDVAVAGAARALLCHMGPGACL